MHICGRFYLWLQPARASVCVAEQKSTPTTAWSTFLGARNLSRPGSSHATLRVASPALPTRRRDWNLPRARRAVLAAADHDGRNPRFVSETPNAGDLQ